MLHNLVVGLAMDTLSSYEQLEPADFLVRQLRFIEQSSGGIILGNAVRAGQHMRYLVHLSCCWGTLLLCCRGSTLVAASHLQLHYCLWLVVLGSTCAIWCVCSSAVVSACRWPLHTRLPASMCVFVTAEAPSKLGTTCAEDLFLCRRGTVRAPSRTCWSRALRTSASSCRCSTFLACYCLLRQTWLLASSVPTRAANACMALARPGSELA